MGRGKVWGGQETLDLAESFVMISEDHGQSTVRGTNQTGRMLLERVIEQFKSKAPQDAADGTYGTRANTAIENHWKDNIKPNVRKLNNALLKVFSAKPTGLNEQNKINAAVAIVCGETKSFAYSFKDYEAASWKYYECWKLLKNHRSFQPPADPMNAVNDGGDDLEGQGGDGAEREGTAGETTNDESADDENASPANATAALAAAAKKRRGGPGRKGAKGKFTDEKYKKQKLEKQDKIIALLEQKQESLSDLANNNKLAAAFAMAEKRFSFAVKMKNRGMVEYWQSTMDNVMTEMGFRFETSSVTTNGRNNHSNSVERTTAGEQNDYLALVTNIRSSMRTKHHAAMNKMQTEHRATLDKMQAEHRATLDKMQAARRTTMNEMQTEHRATVASLDLEKDQLQARLLLCESFSAQGCRDSLEQEDQAPSTDSQCMKQEAVPTRVHQSNTSKLQLDLLRKQIPKADHSSEEGDSFNQSGSKRKNIDTQSTASPIKKQRSVDASEASSTQPTSAGGGCTVAATRETYEALKDTTGMSDANCASDN